MSHPAFATPKEQHIYTASPGIRIAALARYGILFLLPCGMIIFIVFFTNIVADLLVVPFCLALAAFIAWAYIWKTRVLLTTSSEGISFTSIAYSISTPWDNVEGIGWRSENTEEESTIQGLSLYQPAPVFRVHRWGRFLLPYQAQRFIPIETVVKPWKNTALAEDLRRYVPHVFQE